MNEEPNQVEIDVRQDMGPEETQLLLDRVTMFANVAGLSATLSSEGQDLTYGRLQNFVSPDGLVTVPTLTIVATGERAAFLHSLLREHDVKVNPEKIQMDLPEGKQLVKV